MKIFVGIMAVLGVIFLILPLETKLTILVYMLPIAALVGGSAVSVVTQKIEGVITGAITGAVLTAMAPLIIESFRQSIIIAFGK